MKRLCYTLLAGILLVSCNLSRTYFRATETSMLPTIKVGSIVKIARQVNSLDYGDIVVFNFDGK
ncbi:MAG: S26 family signal peptidase [Candidatus Azobacteroides sp.]|nr:S26 family signal peptidase [Candidatus Azobacteroides sp.]